MNPPILLVDVVSAEREASKASSNNQNYDVVTTDNAEFARQMWLGLEPDLVLFDDHLPRGRGADLSRRPKQSLLHRLTSFVLVSSKAIPEELVAGREAGAADFSGRP